MSSAPGDLAPGPILPERLRRFLVSPAEGWLTVGFVAVMAMTVAWSLDDAAWVLNRSEWGDFYAWGTLIAVLVSLAGAKAGWSRWVVHLAGAIAAALILPIMVGSILLPEGGSPIDFYRATATSMTNAWIDFAILRLSLTNQTGHHLLAIGILAWSVGQFAGYAVFGHRRPLDAFIVVGILLIGNMAITPNDQLWFLVIFSVVGLCVLARGHAFDEETTWIRRRIGDANSVRSIYLRGGAVFISAAVFGALVLTASASSDPLAGAWRGFDRQLLDWSRELQRFLPFGGATRVGGFGFGNNAPILGRWVSDNRLAVTISVPPGETEKFYWRVVTFDKFNLSAWTWSNPTEIRRVAGQQVLLGLAEDRTEVYARRDVTYQVDVNAAVGGFVFSPRDPLFVDRETQVQVVGGQAWFSGLEVQGDSYRVTASVPVEGEEGNGLTANRLRAAGQSYSEELKRLYVDLPEGAVGPNARELLDQFLDELGPDPNPYDLALAIEDRLKSSREFSYNDNIGSLCDGMSAAECFAQHKRGYCLHYATTMAVLLREAGIPARMALGYLPGDRDRITGVETIRASGAHAWVEVWFPGFGWQMFDPTGGLSQTAPLADGPRVTPAPSVAPTFGSFDLGGLDQEGPSRNPNLTPLNPTGASGGASPALLVAFAVLLLVGIGALAFVAWQRGPRGEISPDTVWRGIGRTAARFGFGPRPQQTVYEYAGTLGDVLPTNRPELQTVARAKVEVAYGRRELGDDTLRGLRDAQRRLRFNLLKLAFRRRDRRRYKGPKP